MQTQLTNVRVAGGEIAPIVGASEMSSELRLQFDSIGRWLPDHKASCSI